jgi:very-short-patch-repair endonuclease
MAQCEWVSELPEGLHGAFRRADLIQQLGLPTVRALVSQGRLVRCGRQVLVDRKSGLDLRTRAAAALLLVGPRAALTSHTAALLHGCQAADGGIIHVLSGYYRKIPRRPGLAVHHGRVDEDDVLELDGLRTLPLEFVIAEMLCRADRPVALACADQALAAVEPPFRERFRARVAERISGRADPRGTRRGRALLDIASGLPESAAESRMLLILADAQLPLPQLQFAVRDLRGRERYRLDFAWPEPKVALEYDGYEAHEGRGPADAERDADLASRGWTVVRATSADLRDPAWILQVLRTAFVKRRYVA